MIRALGWISGWYVVSISAATVWEYADTASLRLGSTAARGGLILLAIALLTGAVYLVDLWSAFGVHAFRNYKRRDAALIFAVESLFLIALLAPYLWMVVWVLQQAWPYLHEWGMAVDFGRSSVDPLPGWLVWGVLLPGSVLIAWATRRGWRSVAICYANAIRLLGFKRTLYGVLLVGLLRLRLPRRDFFIQSPIFSWLPPLALCVLLHVLIEQPLMRWLAPGLLLCWIVPIWLELIAPPTWLFLGKSDFESFAAFYTMRREWRQHGLTLLNRVGQEGTQFYSAWRQSIGMPPIFFDPSIARVWSLRTRPQLWEHTVQALMDFVLVVVVDLRGDSDIVRDELGWLMKHGRIEKAWFLVADDDALASIQADMRLGSRVVTEKMLLAAEWYGAGLRVGSTAKS